MGLFYSRELKQHLLEYADAKYISDHIKVGHKQGMCLIAMILLFHGDLLNK